MKSLLRQDSQIRISILRHPIFDFSHLATQKSQDSHYYIYQAYNIAVAYDRQTDCQHSLQPINYCTVGSRKFTIYAYKQENNAQSPIHPLLPCADLQQNRNRTRKLVLTLPKTKKPVSQKEPHFGNPRAYKLNKAWARIVAKCQQCSVLIYVKMQYYGKSNHHCQVLNTHPRPQRQQSSPFVKRNKILTANLVSHGKLHTTVCSCKFASSELNLPANHHWLCLILIGYLDFVVYVCRCQHDPIVHILSMLPVNSERMFLTVNAMTGTNIG